MGRPTDYSPELTIVICEKLTQGQSLRTICAEDDMPGKTTVFRWLHDRQEFRDQYARAREVQMELMAEEILEISDDDGQDTITTADGSRTNSEAIARSRLRVDTRKWLMSKLAPKKYGERITAEHSGPNGGPIEIEEKDVPTRDLAKALLAALSRKNDEEGT